MTNEPNDSHGPDHRPESLGSPGRVDSVDALLTRVETIIAECGYASERKLDVIVETSFPTRQYTNALGKNALEMHISYDRVAGNLVIEALSLITYKAVPCKEALLECLTIAVATVPGVRHVLDPASGTVQLRVDVSCDSDGVRDECVRDAMQAIHWFTDAWWPQIASAATSGRYDPNAVKRMLRPSTAKDGPGTIVFQPRSANRSSARKPAKPKNSGRSKKPPTSPKADSQGTTNDAANPKSEKPAKSRGSSRSRKSPEPTASTPPANDFAARAASIANRPGAGSSRLMALRAFHFWLDELRAKGRPLTTADDTNTPPPPDSNCPSEPMAGTNPTEGKPAAAAPESLPPPDAPPGTSMADGPDTEPKSRRKTKEDRADGHDA